MKSYRVFKMWEELKFLVLKISKDLRFLLEEIGLSLLVIGILIVSNFGIYFCYCNIEVVCFFNG